MGRFGGDVRYAAYAFPTSHFQQCCGGANFFIISNLFVTISLSRLKHAQSKLCEQNAEVLKIRRQKYDKLPLKIAQKAPKWP